jgi:curved DNA-binding protein CbpA
MPVNYYSTLQVHTDAEQEIIEAAYKRLARKYHPDISRTTDANLRMQQINEAYEVLADPEKRALYDQEIRHKVFDADELLRQLGLAEQHLLDEQILREDIEEELASVTHQLRIEQLKRKRAERKSEQLADQLKESPARIRHTHPPSASSDAASGKSALLLLQRKYSLLERKLADEQLHNQQLLEELTVVAGQLSKEGSERENATRGLARLEQLLAAEREQREKCEGKIRLAEYEHQAIERAEALRSAEQADKSEPKETIIEERVQRERVENELSAVRRALRQLAEELRT